MHTTIDLLNRALDQHPAPYWTEKMHLSRNAIATAKTRKRLSPTMAGYLAHLLGESEVHWIAVAALEAEKGSKGKTELLHHLKEEWRRL